MKRTSATFNQWLLTGIFVAILCGCANDHEDSIPPPPTIERPEIISDNGEFLLQWNASDKTPPSISYEYQRYIDGILEQAVTSPENSHMHNNLADGDYEFRVRSCASLEICSDWSSVYVSCTKESGGLFCWQKLLDDTLFTLSERRELGDAHVEIWDSILTSNSKGCRLPIRVLRKSGQTNYEPLVYLHGGGWTSSVRKLLQNGGSDTIYDFKNRYGITAWKLIKDNPEPIFDKNETYDAEATESAFHSERGGLISLLNENYMIFDVEYTGVNWSAWEDQNCTGRLQETLEYAAGVVEDLYNPDAHPYNLPTDSLANKLPILIGRSAGGHLAHYIATHQPEKVRGVVNLSGPISWAQYMHWKSAGKVNFSSMFEAIILSVVENALDRANIIGQGLFETQPDVVGLSAFSIPQALRANSFDVFYNHYEVNTPPVYYVNFAHDYIYTKAGLGDLTISGLLGDHFCSYTSSGNNYIAVTVAKYETVYNTRRLVDCGDGNYLDQFYDDAEVPGDHLALIRAHASTTESQLKTILEWLRYGLVTSASY